MKTSEVIQLVSKGKPFSGISEKQKAWIVGVAIREDQVHLQGINPFYVFLPDNRVFKIKQAQIMASGGSYGARKAVQGRFTMELCYHIVFTDTGLTEFCNYLEYERLIREGYPVEIYYGWTFQSATNAPLV